jgi:hypothetical protein
MAYFIFLKSLRSPGEFRKNPHVKIRPKSPCANFQSLGIFKNKLYSEKNFPVTFGPSGLSAQPRPILFLLNWPFFSPLPHWASASRPTQPTLTAQPATIFFLPHRSQAHTAPPASLAPPPRSTPTPPPEEKKWPHQPGPLKLLQRRPLKALGLSRLASAL